MSPSRPPSVELCLDVQMDEEAKSILLHPERHQNALLDVTVIKPKELEAFGTRRVNVMRPAEVRKLISSMEKRRREKQKLIKDLKYEAATIIKVRKHRDRFADEDRRFHEPHYEDRRSEDRRKYQRFGKLKRYETSSSDCIPHTKQPNKRYEHVDKNHQNSRKMRSYDSSSYSDGYVPKNRPSPRPPPTNLVNVGDSMYPLFCEIKRSLRNVETKISSLQDLNFIISETTTTETTSKMFMCHQRNRDAKYHKLINHGDHSRSNPGSHLRNPLTYRVCKPSKSSLVCKNQNSSKIAGEQCFCENCGAVGLISECGKRPFWPADIEPPTRDVPQLYRRRIHKNERNMKQKLDRIDQNNYGSVDGGEAEQDQDYYDRLSKRIKLLEERLAEQEQMLVPRDQFKRTINRIVTNFSPKTKKHQIVATTDAETTLGYSDINNNNNNNNGMGSDDLSDSNPEFSTKVCRKSCCVQKKSVHFNGTSCGSTPRPKFPSQNVNLFSDQECEVNCFHMSPVYNNNNPANSGKTCEKAISNPAKVKSDKATLTDEPIPGNFWKWGEDILKPGIDLKNKIVTLLNEILSRFSVVEKNSAGNHHQPNHPQPPPTYFARNITVTKEPVLSENKYTSYEYSEARVNMGTVPAQRGQGVQYGGDHLRNFDVKHSSRHFSQTCFLNPPAAASNRPANTTEGTKKVDVAYVNPKLSAWNKDSQIACKAVTTSQFKTIRDGKTGKEEFLKMISKADPLQRQLLWRNIWNQAKANDQTKEDLIAIKIPVDGDSHTMYEVDLSLAEVERLLNK